MPLESPPILPADLVVELNARFRDRPAAAVLEGALSDPRLGRVALVSSFGAESVVLLHLVSRIDRSFPVLFVDTQMLFRETLDYQIQLAEILGLADIRTIRPDSSEVLSRDVDNLLHLTDPDACCALRKTEPLEDALSGFDAWITGRKRYQGAARSDLGCFETDGSGRIKLNPLAHWVRQDIADYIAKNRLPPHPLLSRGFASIGCAPCTTPVRPGEDARAGRWRGRDKRECGIHFIGGRLVRVGREEAGA